MITHTQKEHQNELKRLAAQRAVEFVPHGEVIGIGTGSTVNFFIEALAQEPGLIKGAVPTSAKTTQMLKRYDIPVVSLSDVNGLPVYVDGADEINHSLQMIKGGGGALFQEKLVANVSDRFICIADEGKYVSRLGEFPLPVEVVPVARSYVARQLLKLGAQPELRLDYITDNGNNILDCHQFYVDMPLEVENRISEIIGVVACGIFAKRHADMLILAADTGVEVIS